MPASSSRVATWIAWALFVCTAWGAAAPLGSAQAGVTGPATAEGARRMWFPLSLRFAGPVASEGDAQPNPFLDYRLVVFLRAPDGQTRIAHGFFDGDGAGGASGDVWRVRFTPHVRGRWQYRVFFHSGPGIALSLDPNAGTPLPLHGAKGFVMVQPRDPDAPGFHSRGQLEHVGEPYLRFQDGSYFLKGGTDSPENLFGYAGFDNTFDQPGGADTAGLLGGVHRYAAHVQDWQPGDPLFQSADTGVDSKGLIGALNYLASKEVNSVYFLPMNLGGDGRETAPFVSYADTAYAKTHYDLSKLAQWQAVFEHAQRLGVLLHVVLSETEVENETYLDDGALGVERGLFFREMVSRFSWALALKWNLGEESDFSAGELRAFADRLLELDPVDHPIAFHTHILPADGSYGPYQAVLGDARFGMTSLQGHPANAGTFVERWRASSAAAGWPWVVEYDEQAPSWMGLTTANADLMRKEALWDVYLSGGGIEWYAGYHDLRLGGDVRLEDFRTREEMWEDMAHARRFLEQLPFWQMEPRDELLAGESQAYGGGEVFALDGELYAVYLPSAQPAGTLDLTGTAGSFRQRWFDPRTGSFVGAVTSFSGGSPRLLGAPPHSSGEDWVVLIER